MLGAAEDSGDIVWWENTTGDGSAWTAHIVDDAFPIPLSVRAADVDGDGDIDALAAGYGVDEITWWENTAGDGSVWTEHTFPAQGALEIDVADMDGDGDIDVLGASGDGDSIVWWDNETLHRSAAYPIGQTIATPAVHARSMNSADVDGDGDSDVMVAGTFASTRRMPPIHCVNAKDGTQLAQLRVC